MANLQPHSHGCTRRQLVCALVIGSTARYVYAKPQPRTLRVWKDPSCGCCKDWITILEKEGFTATVFDVGNNAARARLGIPKDFGSCHTAFVEGYAIEGHVPIKDIQRLLTEKPEAIGLAVPRMPVGSPGMDGPIYEGRRDPYKVLLIQKDGSTKVFNSY